MIALAIAGVCADETGGEAAPEPYNYAYDAGSHAAAEQRGADGKVTGYYTLGKLKRQAHDDLSNIGR